MRTTQSIGETEALLDRIDETDLPPVVSELLTEYDDVVGERDRFLWQWLYYLFPRIRLSCVPATAGDSVRTAKLLASLYLVLLDDLAEIEKDRRTFREAAKVPMPHQTREPSRPDVDGAFVEFAARVWERLEEVLETAPRGDRYRDLLTFDLEQSLNAVEYSYLANEHLELASVEEATLYESHNMMLFTYVDLDLLFSPAFDGAELATLRKVVRRAQQMARIGNWVTTWERELDERDFTSGVVAYALENGVVSRQQLDRLGDDGPADERESIARAIRNAEIEAWFLRQWRECYREASAYEDHLRSVDVAAFLDGMETVLACHLASRGMK